eukprot:CAMPEP_0194203236 /NCGR_PEP_ID=MMETSP0156-20130528/3074_1 /TAXON_ID=33649 /ORGANISM="Thalassionema nitzschioides, Strain L26-B" /LENGTH=909 /DNA_ID=CAMNT_0038928943 /DNA_START=116 /DNA_END=2845 /DNA_ORIENTATION=+
MSTADRTSFENEGFEVGTANGSNNHDVLLEQNVQRLTPSGIEKDLSKGYGSSILTEATRQEIVSLIHRETNNNNKNNNNVNDACADLEKANSNDGDKPPPPPADCCDLLPKDTYSFLVFAQLSSSSFLLATGVFIVQIFSLIIVLRDQLVGGNQTESNKLGLPVFTTVGVAITQLLALMLAVLYQMDVLWSINLFFKGYDEKAFRTMFKHQKEVEPSRLKLRWYTSNTLRLAQGLLGLVVMFMLIMRASTGRNVLLSFNVINFIGGFDNALYGLAKWGYFSKHITASADHPLIGDVNFAVVAESKKWPLRSLRTATVGILWLILMGNWAWLVSKQMNGDFVPQSVHVQFGDNENLELGLYSGIYDVQVLANNLKYVARPSPEDYKYQISSRTVKEFTYCKLDRVWTFHAHDADNNNDLDVCSDWLAKSSQTPSFNILSVVTSKWFVHGTGRNGVVAMNSFRMLHRPTSICSDGQYGPTCEYEEDSLCKSLVIRGSAFNSELSKNSALYGVTVTKNDNGNYIVESYYINQYDIDQTRTYEVYNVIRDSSINNGNAIQVNGRPLFYTKLDVKGITGITDDVDPLLHVYGIIVSVGRRYARLVVATRAKSTKLTDAYDLLTSSMFLLEERFKGFEGATKLLRYITHFSEPFDIGTASDTGLPVGLTWYDVSAELDIDNIVNVEALVVKHKFICKCGVCPGGGGTMPVENRDISVQIDWALSSFAGQTLTCGEIDELSNSAADGSLQCRSLQMTSIFDCGCPYVPPEPDQRLEFCPLCVDSSEEVKYEFQGVIPYENGPLGSATCAELPWGISLRAAYNMRDSPTYCPTFQASYGAACGCQNPPSYPGDFSCPASSSGSGNKFVPERRVDSFLGDPKGDYCGTILARMSWQIHLCNDEWKGALAEACCTSSAV